VVITESKLILLSPQKEVTMEVNLKVYCKNCKYFPRFILNAFARCKSKDIRNDWDSLRWYRRFCELKNMFNDCPDYEKRK